SRSSGRSTSVSSASRISLEMVIHASFRESMDQISHTQKIGHSLALLGVDLTQIHGIGVSLALKLVAECGTDLRAWPSAKHFTSWLCLAPGNKISGGKLLSSRTRRSSSRAAALLRLAATTLGRSDTALGAFYRRLSARVGKAKAVTATARKIAVLFYNTLRYGMVYTDPGAGHYDEIHRKRVVSNLHRRAQSLGFVLHPIPVATDPAVS
ncbi:transposase, partial [Komagataeibacter sp. SM21]|uniref:transposase n=1 Tax=Komagataeibacter sp. SM21 TaxID=3242899 RepID=UPI0035270DB5